MTSYQKKIKNLIKNCGVLLLSCSLVTPVSVFAAEPNTPKEEVAYVNLNGDGSVKELNIVNIFQLDKDQEIIDYGDYQSVRNMTTNDQIDYTGDTVHIHAKSGKLYYEGKCSDSVIPWKVDIHYYMDGKEYSADEIAGMSGALKIAVDISKNNACGGNFFDTHALQMTVMLDTDKCSNIQTDGATVANAGGDKQLTYTLLPGKETSIEITSDVTEFEMDRISINGIPLNLNVDVDDTALKNQVEKLSDAIGKLDDGASELDDGTAELQNRVQSDLKSGAQDLSGGADELQTGAASLKDGGNSLKSGADELKDGASRLDEGIQSLDEGIQQAETALDELNSQSAALVNGSSDMKTALSELAAKASDSQEGISFDMYKKIMLQNGLDIDTLKQQNDAAAASLQSMIASLQEQAAAMQGAGMDTSAVEAQIQQLSGIAALLAADSGSISGTEAYLTAAGQSLGEQTSALQSAVSTIASEYGKLDDGIVRYTDAVGEIAKGSEQLSSGSSQLVSGSQTLLSGTKSLCSGADELTDGIDTLYRGTSTLKDGTASLDEGASELADGVSQLHDGTDELKEGTAKIKEKTSGMDKKIDKKIDKMLESITGEDKKVVSFASPENTNINAVQFVIQTDAIEIPEKEAAETPENEPSSFLDKLLALFR